LPRFVLGDVVDVSNRRAGVVGDNSCAGSPSIDRVTVEEFPTVIVAVPDSDKLFWFLGAIHDESFPASDGPSAEPDDAESDPSGEKAFRFWTTCDSGASAE
jgi:hypothetical protein